MLLFLYFRGNTAILKNNSIGVPTAVVVTRAPVNSVPTVSMTQVVGSQVVAQPVTQLKVQKTIQTVAQVRLICTVNRDKISLCIYFYISIFLLTAFYLIYSNIWISSRDLFTFFLTEFGFCEILSSILIFVKKYDFVNVIVIFSSCLSKIHLYTYIYI